MVITVMTIVFSVVILVYGQLILQTVLDMFGLEGENI